SNRHRAVRPLNLHRPTTHADLDVLCRFTPRRLLVFHVDAEASTRYSHDDPRRLNVELSLGVVDDIALDLALFEFESELVSDLLLYAQPAVGRELHTRAVFEIDRKAVRIRFQGRLLQRRD